MAENPLKSKTAINNTIPPNEDHPELLEQGVFHPQECEAIR